ncbi:hypothetical protein PILCRDRAFT_813830 [Piloderma croceum F 1598]|uniref:FAD dependent oxidoreductase domain-containing protein n=1 Tax=Piloderma croceum (strain F 1598) TaxID=765440 RepID=A0A0C3BQR6_PILCF|nr:hypothetical protein PILCRDRAFT_813830 [Piloderma croceum F 1598]
MSKDPRTVVIIGAGVIGLTIAHVLSSDPSNACEIVMIARDMPEDIDSQGWASPWAGANWTPMPMGGLDERIKRWETVTFNKLWDMIPTGLVKPLPSRMYSDQENNFVDPWYKDLPRDFRVLPSHDIPSVYKSGIGFTTISVNPSVYLSWLKSQLESRGVQFVRKKLRSIEEAADAAGPDGIVVNATSLGARSLIGVQDTKMYPVRGQTILVHAPHLREFLGEAEVYPNGGVTYMIPRPGPDSTVLLGGTTQAHNWDTSYDKETSDQIFTRCAALEPRLLEKDTVHVLSHNVGLRPAREGGPRVEIEWMKLPLEGRLVPRMDSAIPQARKVLVLHAYGFGPAGYQESWGAAEEAVNLLKSSILRSGSN